MLKEFQDRTTGLNIHIHLTSPSPYLLEHRSQLLPGFPSLLETVAIVLFQAQAELVAESEAIAREKERLLGQFLLLGRTVRELSNFPTEIICPRSGFPLYSKPGEQHFDIVAIAHESLKIQFQPTGDRCKVLSYLDWQTAVYPCLFIASASPAQVEAVLNNIYGTYAPAP
ncbi:hypothetical protein [Spirulina sp. 06S082]|uniref:hypothetical protein n=1 Tax=Spirulina sp. 06S082 TaxID=3110248 RepID=UPI002B206D10|nr:hypothetical protein [Spirulina sp. 06S082]MEA5467923.1 hypothetical protein [Spirulina sp. 06S082]